MDEKIIGIVGGMGPLAGLDLCHKIVSQTVAASDQEHLTVINLSRPAAIPDRTEYLLGKTSLNPAYPIAEQLRMLATMGAQVAGLPCNTAHAPAIWGVIVQELAGVPVQLLNMVQETAVFLRTHYPHIQRVGILSTTGTYQTRIYPQALEQAGFTAVVPAWQLQEEVIHTAVYHPTYGIKSCGPTPTARANLLAGIHHLQEHGAQAIILGCTEMPLAIQELHLDGLPLVDPTLVLARALVREANPSKLYRKSTS